MGQSSHTYGQAKNLTAKASLDNNSTPTGFIGFAGWATANNSATVAYTDEANGSTMNAANGATVNLYAVWTRDAKFYTEAQPVSAADVQNKDQEFYSNFYGSVVNNYGASLSTSENNKWKIFYADENNIYLISDGFIHRDTLPTKTVNGTSYTYDKNSSTGYEYVGGINNVNSGLLTLYPTGGDDIVDTTYATAETIKKLNKDFTEKGYTGNGQPNMRFVASMLDTDLWKSFMDDDSGNGKAQYAIGGPTYEMLVNSYNQSHGTSYTCETTNNPYQGYDYNSKTLSTDCNNIYLIDGVNAAQNWYLASPFGYQNNLVEYVGITTTGIMSFTVGYDGFRPIVCLKSDVLLSKVGDYEYKIVDSANVGVKTETQYYNPAGSGTYSVTPPTQESKDGWTSGGWRTDVQAGEGTTGNLTSNSDKFYSVYTRTANFYSGVNKATTKTATQYYNNVSLAYTVTIPQAPTAISGWTTIGWRNDTKATTQSYPSTGTITTSKQNFYAVYSKAVADKTGYYNSGMGNMPVYVGETPYTELTLDGAMLLSAVPLETPSVTTNSAVKWTSSNSNIVDVSLNNGIIKCGTQTGTATVYCKDTSGNLIGQVSVTSTAKIAKTANASANTRISGNSAWNNPTIPAGYSAITTNDAAWTTGTSTQANVNNGLTIMDDRGNQFVWVPVPYAIYNSSDGTPLNTSTYTTLSSSTYTPMAIAAAGDYGGIYKGLLYQYSNNRDARLYYYNNASTNYQGTTSQYREPAILTSTSYDGNPAYHKDILGYNDVNAFGTAMEDDYDNMVTSVSTYKGFWMARYEGSWDDSQSKIASIAGARSSDSTQKNTNRWYGLYKAMRDYSGSSTYYKSSMIWGSQYDAMLNWMAKNSVTVGTSTPMSGTARNTSRITGTPTYNDKLKNIVDIYGNSCEWTQEAYNTYGRVYRGGYFSSSNSPSNRNSISPSYTNYDVSSRPSLYIAPVTGVLTANFNANGGTFGSSTTNTVTYNNVIDGVATSQTGTYKEPTRTGYNFTGWNTAADGTGITYKDETAILKKALSITGTLYAQWETIGLYVGQDKYKTLNLDGAMLLSATSQETPSVTTNSSYRWESSNSNIVDVSVGGGIIKCGTQTGTAIVTCKDASNNIIGNVLVTSTSKILDIETNKGTNINANRRISGNAAYNNPTIPYGFQAIDTGIGLKGEGNTAIDATWSTGATQANVNKGLVIMDNRGNQFVWVPVPDVIGTPSTTSGVNLSSNPSTTRPMARISSGSNYQGNLYTFSGTTSTYQSGYTASGSSYGEPRYLSRTSYDANTSYGNLFTSTELQTNYNTMVASVNTYKGFWMARYEGSWDDSQGKIASIAGARSSDASQTNTNRWYGLYTAMKNYSGNSSYYTSEMIWGSQYDAMMNWMAKNSVTVGNRTLMSGTARNTTRITGTPVYNDKLKNIVDIYGNSLEWAQEAYDTGFRVCRGGVYYGSIDLPSDRHYATPDSTSYYFYSSRPSLYIK